MAKVLNDKTGLELKYEKKQFTDDNGVVRDYINYYVDVNGIKIRLRPNDATAREVLKLHLNII